MALSYDSFADSEPFKFLVGEAGKPFYIHRTLVARQSDTMSTLVDGIMLESQRKYAIWDDVDEGTFIRFMEFMYSGDYAAAEPEILLSQSDIGTSNSPPMNGEDPETLDSSMLEEPVAEAPLYDDGPPPPPPAEDPVEETGYGLASLSLKKKSKKKHKEKYDFSFVDNRAVDQPVQMFGNWKSKGAILWDSFQSSAVVRPTTPWQPNVNEDSCEQFTPVFLSHAKLYKIADKYSIKPLLELALSKLRLTLSAFTLHPERVGDVIELLEFTYEHTMDYDETIDRLRNLVSDYVVCHVEKIVKHDDFIRLLQTNGDVAKDLMLKLMQRLD